MAQSGASGPAGGGGSPHNGEVALLQGSPQEVTLLQGRHRAQIATLEGDLATQRALLGQAPEQPTLTLS